MFSKMKIGLPEKCPSLRRALAPAASGWENLGPLPCFLREGDSHGLGPPHFSRPGPSHGQKNQHARERGGVEGGTSVLKGKTFLLL